MKSARMIVNGDTFTLSFEEDSLGTREISYAAYCIHARLVLNQLDGHRNFDLVYYADIDEVHILAPTPGTKWMVVYRGRVALSGSQCHDFFKRTGVNLLME